jgi:hypothetical protein
MSSENDWIDGPDNEEQWGPWIYCDPEDKKCPTYAGDAVQIEFYNGQIPKIKDAEEWGWGGTGDYSIRNYRVRHVGPWIEVPDNQMKCPCDGEHYIEVKLLGGILSPNLARASYYTWDLPPGSRSRILKFRHVSKEYHDKHSI